MTKTTAPLSLLSLCWLLSSCSDSQVDQLAPVVDTGNPPGTTPPSSSNNPPSAAAGPDQDGVTGARVMLDGAASNDADGDSLSYRWLQTYGPDVTGGTGLLAAEMTPDFVAPDEISTLIFELVTNDGTVDSGPDEVRVNIFENVELAFFVDGDNGSDVDGNGTRQSPYQTLSHAIGNTTTSGEDIYLMTRADGESYQESLSTLEMTFSSSLYGGYDANWIRDVTDNRTPVAGFHTALKYAAAAVSSPTWISGLEITARRSFDHGTSVMAIVVEGATSSLTIENNTLISSDVGPDTCSQQVTADCLAAEPGSSYGVVVKDLASAIIRANRITAGQGGDGDVGNAGMDGAPGDDGGAGFRTRGGENYSEGGRGGHGGFAGGDNGGDGIEGSCAHPGTGTTPGAGGIGGSGAGFDGDHGNNGRPGSGVAWNGGVGFHNNPPVGGTGHGDVATDSVFKPSSGGERLTTRAANGCAGGGGGGGEGASLSGSRDGGAGGGGGGGGQGGAGGHGGAGGGASIGIWLYHTATAAEIVANTIHTSAGGDGNLGGAGGKGGAGGSGALGEDGAGRAGTVCTVTVGYCGGNGGRGGNGARGGNGSQGGGGGGGPSYGIFVGPDMAPMINGNVIQTDQGGRGGVGGNGGDGGWSYGVYAVDAGVGCCLPTLLQNSITFGQGGVAGFGSDIGDGADHDGIGGKVGRTNWQ